MNENIKQLLLSDSNEDFNLAVNILKKQEYVWTYEALEQLTKASEDWDFSDQLVKHVRTPIVPKRFRKFTWAQSGVFIRDVTRIVKYEPKD